MGILLGGKRGLERWQEAGGLVEAGCWRGKRGYKRVNKSDK